MIIKMEHLVEDLASELCNNADARAVAGDSDEPQYFDSAPHVQDYWRKIACAALGCLKERENDNVDT